MQNSIIKKVYATLRLYSPKFQIARSKDLSIPQLELLACLSEKMKSIFNAIPTQISSDKVFCWSDSQIALWQIKQVH